MSAVIRYTAMAVLVLATSLACSAASLPLDVRAAADNFHCEEIAEFAERPGMLDPPYIYGYVGDKKSESVVFWCRDKKVPRRFKLVVHTRNPAFQCPPVIETNSYPGGLSLFSDESLSLSLFSYVASGKKASSVPQRPRGKFIRSHYDGAEDIYYCSDGQWLHLFRH